MSDNTINSKEYWDGRFREDWVVRQGRDQSRFFGALAARLLPDWIKQATRTQGLSWCDWGCALGDGTNELAVALGITGLTGVDFSDVAIADARCHYPGQTFVAEDWLDQGEVSAKYDVVFSSNTLEHFRSPWKALDDVSARARRAVALLLPFREWFRIDEHHATFEPDNIPVTLADGKVLVHVAVVDVSADQPCYWPGEQAMLVWAEPEWLGDQALRLAQVEFSTEAPRTVAPIRDDIVELAGELDAVLARTSELEPGKSKSIEYIRARLRLWQAIRQPVTTIMPLAERSLTHARDKAQLDEALAAIAPWLIGQDALTRIQDKWLQAEARVSAVTQELEARDAQLEAWCAEREVMSSQLAGLLVEVERLRMDLQLERSAREALVQSEAGWRSAAQTERDASLLAQQTVVKLETENGRLRERLLEAESGSQEAHRLVEEERALREEHRRNGDLELAFRDAVILGKASRVSLLERQMEELMASRSWRVTAPLRTASIVTSRIRGAVASRLRQRSSKLTVPTNPVASILHSAREGQVPSAPLEESKRGAEVVHLVQHFVAGGLERVVLDLCVEMKKSGTDCAIIVLGHLGDIAEEARECGISVLTANEDPASVLDLTQGLGATTCLVHHAYTGIDALHVHGVRVIEVLHNAYHWQVDVDWFAHLRSRSVDGYVAVSGFVREFSIAKLRLPGNKVELINNGLNLRGLIRPPMEIMQGRRLATIHAPRFIFAANLQLQKNHLLVLKAFSAFLQRSPSAHLVMLGDLGGDATAREAVLSVAAPLIEAGALTLPGSVNRRMLSRELAKAHVAMLPTQLEGFSIATLEFAFFGLPSILSETGASVELAEAYGHVVMAAGAATSSDDLSTNAVERRFYSPGSDAVSALATAMEEIVSAYPDYLAAATVAAASCSQYRVSATSKAYLSRISSMKDMTRDAA